MIADWPGLKQAQLYEERDLEAHHRSARGAQGPAPRSSEVDERALASTVFPDSIGVAPIAGLVG